MLLEVAGIFLSAWLISQLLLVLIEWLENLRGT